MKVKITIDLVYDLDQLGITDWRDFKDITDGLEDRVYDDLHDLMRYDRLYYWSDIKTIEEENN